MHRLMLPFKGGLDGDPGAREYMACCLCAPCPSLDPARAKMCSPVLVLGDPSPSQMSCAVSRPFSKQNLTPENRREPGTCLSPKPSEDCGANVRVISTDLATMNSTGVNFTTMIAYKGMSSSSLGPCHSFNGKDP